MSVLVALPNGKMRAFCKGASEIILNICDKVVSEDGDIVQMSDKQRKAITDVLNGFACDALRTICLAFQDLEAGSSSDDIPENNYTIIAVVGIKDPVRPGSKGCSIARECGIMTPDGLAIEGPEFREKSVEQLREIIPRLQVMARSLPLDKHKLVTLLRNEYREGYAELVAKENADVVIMDDNFKTILTVNVVALMTNFVSACTSGSAPLTAVQLLWVNMIMDTLGALALATEPPNDALMKRPPIGRDVNFITKIMHEYFASLVPQSWNLCLLSVSHGAISLPVGALLKCIPVKSSTDVGVIKQHDGYEPLPRGPVDMGFLVF
ncbi:calcium-transporting ATPase 4, plasma membrane-type-like protein isoform X2 [Tanacetum coccineum]